MQNLQSALEHNFILSVNWMTKYNIWPQWIQKFVLFACERSRINTKIVTKSFKYKDNFELWVSDIYYIILCTLKNELKTYIYDFIQRLNLKASQNFKLLTTTTTVQFDCNKSFICFRIFEIIQWYFLPQEKNKFTSNSIWTLFFSLLARPEASKKALTRICWN